MGAFKFFNGRYGFDFMFYALCIMQMLLIVIGAAARIFGLAAVYYALYAIQLMLLAYTLFRVLSKNREARVRENAFLIRTLGRLKTKLRKKRISTDERVVVVCPKCNANIRVKNIKGKHGLICPRCSNEFKIKL